MSTPFQQKPKRSRHDGGFATGTFATGTHKKGGNVSGGAEALDTASDGHAVRVLQFAAARAQELQALASAVMAFNGHRLAFQQLPRHMRRRAASHNVYRLPAHIRADARLQKQKSGGTADSGSRRKRRRCAFKQQEWASRSSKQGWLETHVWHAKRMHMQSHWGHRIAVRSASKSVKFTHRAIKRGAVVQDISFHHVIQLHAPAARLISCLMLMFPGCNQLKCRDTIAGGVEVTAMLHAAAQGGDGGGQPIAPVQFTVQSLSAAQPSRMCWVWIHPAAAAACNFGPRSESI